MSDVDTNGQRSPKRRIVRRIPTAIWALGFVSLLMNISSEMIHSLLPVFMVTALGASALAVGLITPSNAVRIASSASTEVRA